ncbi:Thioredoxin-like protein [Apiospora marii]|uniref:Thioredoxin-like protein n=1 Tax=Apiospora marii TaxID=335849 RepID=A0ABR1RLM8_9PEZI
MDEKGSVNCTLYCYPFSLYSIMVRYLIQLAKASGEAHDATSSALSIQRCQVPAMMVEGRAAPITDSLDISYWLCDMFPQLLPSQHEATIRRLLRDLHAIEGISVTIRRREGPEEDLIDPCVDNALARDDISLEYRQALEAKKIFDDTHIPKASHHANVDRAEQQTASLLAEVARLYEQHGGKKGTWLLDEDPDTGPTLLDAQVVPFVTRLEDAGRARLVPDGLRRYAADRRASPEWDVVMGGRGTIGRKGDDGQLFDMLAEVPPTTLFMPLRG